MNNIACLRSLASIASAWRPCILLLLATQILNLSAGIAEESTSSLIEFKRKSIDAGRILQGHVVQQEFSFSNSGGLPLRVKNVEAGCSCSVADFPREPVPPGKSGVIQVGIKTAGRRGLFRGTFRVTCSAGDREWQEELAVAILITAEGKVSADPASVYLGEMTPGKEVVRTIALSVPEHADRPIQITSVRAPNWLKTVVRNGEKRDSWSLELSGRVPDASGELLETVTIETTSKVFPKVEVPVIGFINGSVRLQPRSVLKVVSPTNSSLECTVTVTDRRQQVVQIERVELSGIDKDNLTVSIPPVAAGDAAVILLRPTFSDGSQRTIKGAVLVTIRVPGAIAETVRLPVLFVQSQKTAVTSK